MGEVRIVGTSHISAHSVRDIECAFEDFKPDIVAVELDRRRLETLLARQKGEKTHVPLSMARQVGALGWLFLRIGGWLQKKLGDVVSMEPGADMLRAVELARDGGRRVALVDRDILVTLKRLKLSWREKGRLAWDAVSGPFQKRLRIDLRKVPPKEVIRQLMGIMRERYPGFYVPLVHERNVHMANRIKGIRDAHPDARILLVIGAGHEDGVRELLGTR